MRVALCDYRIPTLYALYIYSVYEVWTMSVYLVGWKWCGVVAWVGSVFGKDLENNFDLFALN